MKKHLPLLIIAVIFIIMFSFVNFKNDSEVNDSEKIFNVGVLAYLGTNEEDFQKGFDEFRNFVISSDSGQDLLKDNFINSLVQNRRIIHFYNSLMALIMDLKSKKLDEIILPENVGHYLLNHDNSYQNVFSTKILSSGACFGFRIDNAELMNEFNKILNGMKFDGTLKKFEAQYVIASNDRDPKPIRPEQIKNLPEIKIAVTGDMPPIDMFAGDGNPAGYNTAVLSELGKRLNKNIKFINTDAGGRSAALISGRADVVFWYRMTKSSIAGDDPFDNLFKDAPEGVILSMPYYSWENEMIIRLKDNKNLFGIFSSEK